MLQSGGAGRSISKYTRRKLGGSGVRLIITQSSQPGELREQAGRPLVSYLGANSLPSWSVSIPVVRAPRVLSVLVNKVIQALYPA